MVPCLQRQRDSLRALQLADQADAVWGAGAAKRDARSRRFRLVLMRCEVAALFDRTSEAEEWLASARDGDDVDADGPVDTLLAEIQVADNPHAEAQLHVAAHRFQDFNVPRWSLRRVRRCPWPPRQPKCQTAEMVCH